MEYADKPADFLPPLEELEFFDKVKSLDKALMTSIEAEAPVPINLRNERKELVLLKQLKLSKEIGILLFLNQLGSDYEGVGKRLLFKQRIASEEAIIAGAKFSYQLARSPKLRLENKHLLYYFLSTPFRRVEKKPKHPQRIRGYRDKGTLPDLNHKALSKAQSESWISVLSLEDSESRFILDFLPDYLFEQEYLFLPGTVEYLREEHSILQKLERILFVS